jgi:hypothetical protein
MTGTEHAEREAIWESYVAAWKADGPGAKRELLGRCVAPTSVYTDPLCTTTGVDELVAYMVDFHRQVPGGHFVTTHFLAHHSRSIARWNMVNGQGEVIGEGISYGEYDGSGRLTAMTGFFETPADAAA